MEFRRLPRCGKDADKDKQQQVKNIRDDIKGRIKKLQEELFGLAPGQVIRDLNQLYPMMKCLTELALELGERYRERKEQGAAGFNDLEHLCLQVLLEEGERERGILPKRL